MKITAVLFDLDGTLLPMDQDVFTREYFKLLARNIAPLGYDPHELVNGVLAGTVAMIENDGSKTNAAAFWDKFESIFGARVRGDIPAFDRFYLTEFERIKEICGFDPAAAIAVRTLKERGYTLVLASNPIFPRTAQEARLRWAGVDPADFSYITSYENSSYCKPNPAYYAEIARNIGVECGECVMIGNDTSDDFAAEKAGMRAFLAEGNVINKDGRDVSALSHGALDKVCDWLETL